MHEQEHNNTYDSNISLLRPRRYHHDNADYPLKSPYMMVPPGRQKQPYFADSVCALWGLDSSVSGAKSTHMRY